MNIKILTLLYMIGDFLKGALEIITAFLMLIWFVGIFFLAPILIWSIEEAHIIFKIVITLLYVIPAIIYIILEYYDRLKKLKNN